MRFLGPEVGRYNAIRTRIEIYKCFRQNQYTTYAKGLELHERESFVLSYMI